MSDVIAQQLSGLYRELADRRPFSETAQLDLHGAPASGRVEQLLICLCDGEGLQLVSTFSRWWVVDAGGFHADRKWPLTNAMVQIEGWEMTQPFIKFATEGRRVQFGMLFGPSWYVVLEAPLDRGGRFVPSQLTNVYRSVK